MIKYAIFDLDGTLLDSSEMWNSLGERYLEYFKKKPEAGLAEKLNHMSIPEGAKYLREAYDISFSAEEIARHVLRMIEKFYTEDVRLKDGASKLLVALRSHCVHMSIATAGDERLGMTALTRLGVGDFFSGIVSCANFGSKTTADVFLAAADLIYALPEQTVVFENSLFAVETAKNAGFITAAVSDIAESRQDALKSAADFYAESLGDFAKDVDSILKFR